MTCRLARCLPMRGEYKESPGRAGASSSLSNKGETLEGPASL